MRENRVDSTMELDSHANMVLLGKDGFVFDGVQGRTCNVVPYDPSLGMGKKIPIVDGAVAYDCPYTHRTYILIMRNALYVPTLDHSLIPPFIMREAGLVVNDIPKIHVKDPDTDDHAILFPEDNLKIQLQLSGIFSYFHIRMPLANEIEHCDKVFLTPDSIAWNPYSPHYAENESAMTDWEGKLVDQRYRKKYKKNDDLYSDISSIELMQWNAHIDSVLMSETEPLESKLNSAAQTDVEDLARMLEEKAQISQMSIATGSTGISSLKDDLFDYSFDEDVTFQLDSDDPAVVAAMGEQPDKLDANFLSKIWHIKHEEATKILDQSTQLCRHGANNSLSRQYSTNDRMIRYKRIESTFFTDTFFVTSKGKSTRNNKCAQLFVSDKGYVAIYPMESKRNFLDALKLFCKDVGVPLSLVCDPSGEQTSRDVRKHCHMVGTTLRLLQEATQWANRAELYIGLFKESIRQDIRRTNCPMTLWDYCAERRARIHNVTPKSLFQLNGTNPHTATFGKQPDISNICVFDWYDWCYVREESGIQFPFQKEVLGRVLGPMPNQGNEMVQAILKQNGKVVPRRTCRRLTPSELISPSEIEKRKEFDAAIKSKLGDSISVIQPLPIDDLDPTKEDPDPDDDVPEPPPPVPDEDPVDATGQAVFEQPFTDLLLHAEVLLPQGENLVSGKVVGRSKSADGDIIGNYDNNPLLNTLSYDVEFQDGTVREYGANIIAENIYLQVDENGYGHNVLDSILDHRKGDDAIDVREKYVTTKSGQKRLRKSTVGWDLLVKFKHGEEQWIPLRIVKEAYPVQTVYWDLF